jgi:7-cyano-7-deazaguanine synthase
MSQIEAVAVVSGGMDSTTLLHYLVKRQGLRPALLTYAYGQRHAREIDCARTQAEILGLTAPTLFNLTPFKAAFASSALVDAGKQIPQAADVEGDPQPATYVPFRNLIFLTLAAAYAESHGASRVYYGAQRHDLYGYWDTTPDFLDRVNHVYALNRKSAIKIEAPFINYSKADILRLGFELGVDYGMTWSCYLGGKLACGVCPTCVERLNAFAEVGVADPLPYADSLYQFAMLLV